MPAILDKSTLIPIGAVVALIAASVWLNRSLDSLDHRLESIERSLNQGWTRKDQEIWELRLKVDNPDINVPDSRTIWGMGERR